MAKTILLLEDTERQRLRLTKILEAAGYIVIAFEHPNLARAHYKRNEGIAINAIVSDWDMGRGKMNGFDLLQTVRHGSYERPNYKSKIPKDIPFIMCSSYDPSNNTEKKYKEKALQHGADMYQCKSSQYSLEPMITYLNSKLKNEP
ncbi:MAG: CheY-like chemotaxis protein [Alphaproteobacteria bacterium]|jgi:CheY-like chemotaxis protein